MIRETVSALAVLSALSAVSMTTQAEEATSIGDAFKKGQTSLNMRYRLETVDQDGFLKDATASTLRTKLKFDTAAFNGFSGSVEFENNSSVFSERYNSTINGKSQYPVVADPTATELNQAYLTYKADHFSARAGRQGINLGGQRFVGTVGWRQNDQTYDAVVLNSTAVQDLSLTYAYVWNVNRIFTHKHPYGDLQTATQAVDAAYTGIKGVTVTAYGLWIDMQQGVAVEGLSSKTFGLRLSGKKSGFIYDGEYAKQSDFDGNSANYSADYLAASAGYNTKGFTAKIGYENLGSDQGSSFKTPLATLHKFNGWADKFLSTPANGLEDVYASVAYKFAGDSALGGASIKVIYHDFQSDVGSLDYGSEIDWVVSKSLNNTVSLALKGAHYSAKTFASDTDKLWVQLVAKF